jgi:hypothetical protein
MLFIRLDSKIIPYHNFPLDYFPKEIRLECSGNHLLVYSYGDLILEYPTHILKLYESTIKEVTIQLDDIIKGNNKRLIKMYYKAMKGGQVDIILNGTKTLAILFDGKHMIDIPVLSIKGNDGIRINNNPPMYDYLDEYIKGPVEIQNKLPVEIQVKLPEKIEVLANDKTEDNLCKICMDKELCTINLPCAHLCFCIACSYNYVQGKKDTCPICNEKLVEIKRFYK